MIIQAVTNVHTVEKTAHPSAECWFKDAVCHRCGEKGHISRICQKKGSDNPRKGQKVHSIDFDQQSESSDESSDVSLKRLSLYNTGRSSKQKHSPITIIVKLNGQPVSMEIDTGAAVSIMPLEMAKEVLSDVQICKTTNILKTYTGEGIVPSGVMNVTVEYKKQKKELQLHVLNHQGPALLGRDGSKK